MVSAIQIPIPIKQHDHHDAGDIGRHAMAIIVGLVGLRIAVEIPNLRLCFIGTLRIGIENDPSARGRRFAERNDAVIGLGGWRVFLHGSRGFFGLRPSSIGHGC